ncbi:MAG: hypothetical protein WC422_01750 [Candidatus Paceibacterota bacterium]
MKNLLFLILMLVGKKKACKKQFFVVKNSSEWRGGGKLKEKRIYCFKGDIQKYFDSVDRKILKEIIQKKVKSPGLL